MATRLTSDFNIINGKIVKLDWRKRLSVSERIRQRNSKRIKPTRRAIEDIETIERCADTKDLLR